jgi:starch synthase
VVLASDKVDPKVVEELSAEKGKILIPFKDNNEDLADYLQLYTQLLSK